MKKTTGLRRFNVAIVARRKLTSQERGAYLLDCKRRAGRRKVTQQVSEKVAEFIADSAYVRTSPLQKDTLLVRGADGKKTQRVPRLLLEIGVPEFYKQFVKKHGALVGLGAALIELLSCSNRAARALNTC